MIDPGPLRTAPRQTWWVAALVIVLIALAAPVLLGQTPTHTAARPIRQTSPRPTGALTPTALPATAAASVATPEAVAAPATGGAPTAGPVATPTPRPTAPPRVDHYWLERPIASEGNDRIERAYPYASRQDGTYPIHHGVEFVNPLGTPIRAVADGTIVVAGEDRYQVYGARDGFYGLVVIQRLTQSLYGQPLFVVYGHLSAIAVITGTQIAQGEVIGEVGMTGYAEGPHVHLEVRYGANDYGRTVNPELWLRPRPGYGTLAGVVLGPEGEPLPEVPLVLARANAPTVALRYLTTYPATLVNADPAWGESFATGDLPVGDYVVSFSYRNRTYAQRVTVPDGGTGWVALGAQP